MSTKTYHTHGPWVCERKAHSRHGDFLIFSDHDETFVAEVVGREIESPEEIACNAILIAAAPELLASLKEALNQLEANDMHDVYKRLSNERRNMLSAAKLAARKAIDKAEGRQ